MSPRGVDRRHLSTSDWGGVWPLADMRRALETPLADTRRALGTPLAGRTTAVTIEMPVAVVPGCRNPGIPGRLTGVTDRRARVATRRIPRGGARAWASNADSGSEI